ncbi:3-oxoadipate enol-lactonase [Streptomyces malaysiensis subsp. malaysiensis]|uniref:bifunctional 3-oxoadipate enol-lactonase/4-carboxymuconolactone decarboxylase PcaDC n=1 Tax=Streptomyces malaysiensis TaxID=92644 RepID=UPI000BFDE549|nr:3-oxoadipate enol-lactonase [Streptomyces malaysiensis]ATL82719.1 3-oxoadipate enol-lactone hydrolase [Streptomyces malaysiensis]QDL73032.1 3-oxoadipate enol-lactonase [Streptomyces malaysiensis]
MTNNQPHHDLSGPPTAPPLILGPSIGTSLAVWEPQLPALTRTHRVLRWDLPGHGGSPVALLPSDGSATIGDLAALVLRLADEQGWERFAYAGVSIGGAVGLHLAAHRPERLTSLAVVCSSARFGDPAAWRERAALVRAEGTEAMVASRPGTWFSHGFAHTPVGAALIEDLRATDRAGYAACCDALAAYDITADLERIAVPTLVVAGRDDPATPPAHARRIADAVPGASLLEVAGAAHLAGVERPEPVTAALLAHLTDSTAQPHDDATARPQNDTPYDTTPHTHTPHDTTPHPDTPHTDTTPHTDASRHAAGMAVRRDVLGNAHVDRAVARTTPFTARFQDFITRYAWGEIWTGDGLDRRTRSCITLTALIAHGHDAELAMHIRAALTNGLTREEIGEVLLQSAIYCGVPAANSAFATAQRVFDEIDAEHVTTRASTTTATTTTATTTTKVDTASRSDTEK